MTRMTGSTKAVALLGAGLLITAAMFLLGRFTATPEHRQPTNNLGGYFAGLRAGEAEGRQEGRAAQEGVELPRGAQHVSRQAFDAGYVAGSNDVFAGYDGGWKLHTPWIVTLVGGPGQVVYRIRGREELATGFAYYRCHGGRSVCRERRR
jgi:hypothetical protein